MPTHKQLRSHKIPSGQRGKVTEQKKIDRNHNPLHVPQQLQITGALLPQG